ncbi:TRANSMEMBRANE PROTEIN 18 [Salix purpurea]|uniref:TRANSMEMBRANE PROTEIN 18 n=1 Tax=Salix purpurea TaxID=77065 RepID=A0A9Q0WC56_SALPP|nr:TRANSMEMBRANE PROTEIN 18 [Salix purpurea]
MANNKEKRPGEEEERKIPVFTVLRNGAILKNIFVVSKSPLASPTSPEPSIENEESIQETEEILTFGRHPDCNIVLNHPSISRFHLQINSKPSSQKLFVTDLSSVHGTWISGKKIEPGLRVELNEGDTIKVGGSTRYYRLLWVPMSRAYDMETPFISPSDMTMIEEKREENLVFEEENEVKMSQSPEYFSFQQELPDTEIKGSSMIRESNAEFFSTRTPLSTARVEAQSASEMLGATENGSLLRKGHEPINYFSLGIEMVSSCLPVRDLSENDKNFTENLLANLNSSCSDDHDATDVLEVESHDLSRDDRGQSEYTSICSALLAEESVSSSFPVGFLSDIIDGKKCQTPESVLASIENQENLQSSHVGPEKKLSSHNIWSRRGKPKAVLQLQTIRSRENNRGADVEWENQDYIEKRSVSNTIFPGSEAAEEILTPGKENYSPNTLLLKSLKKKDKENQRPLKFLQQASKNQVKFKQEMLLEECKAERVPLQSLLANFSGNSISVPSDATRSDISVNCSQIMRKSNFAGDGRRRWTMVADTASLVDKESRKSLQLLQGLKGTHLVIPKMVIRELDCLKRRSSLFRRKTEASMLLEWIEECMVRTPWWIHVQSSVEEGRHIAPTPPASPPSRFSQGSEGFPCGSGSSVPFPAHGSLLEIVSPTAEDHILEYALSYRKMNRDGQLILLSNDVTLKIKAMAEGLICETAKEFRDSLVNPFSERFLWADSSPRGLTWSVSDDLVLKDRYYRSPSKKSSKGEGAKGLKLILLHNSQYGQISQSEQVSLFRNK